MATSCARCPVSQRIVDRAQELSTRCVSTSSSSRSTSSRRMPSTAPVAPVIATTSLIIRASISFVYQ
jgi:hypothetical protein